MTPVPGRLYLIVHGLTAVAERNNTFEIALPRVPGHVYKAGSWLAETAIESGNVLELKNVTGGTASIRNTGFLVDVPASSPLTHRRRAATLIVPRPAEVLGLLLSARPGNLKGLPAPPSQAEVLVLVYSYDDEDKVFLDEHYWQPSATGRAISLHVIATSEVAEGMAHEDQTDSALQEVFLNFPGFETFGGPPASWVDASRPDRFGKLNGKAPGTPGYANRRAEGAHVIEGTNDFAFALAELEHPASRLQRLNRLGRMHQEKRRIEGLWRHPDPLCPGDVSACGSMSGT